MTAPSNLEVDHVVLVISSNTPVGHWLIAGMVQVIPGADEVVWTLRLRIATGEWERSVAKNCELEKDFFVQLGPPAVRKRLM